jgi:hypothetical protein
MGSTVWNIIVGEHFSFSTLFLFCLDMVIWLALAISSSGFHVSRCWNARWMMVGAGFIIEETRVTR